MASLDNTKINEIRFINTFFDRRIKNKLSIYVDDLEKLEKIESISLKNVDSEKLKKIINLNAITNFSYAPI